MEYLDCRVVVSDEHGTTIVDDNNRAIHGLCSRFCAAERFIWHTFQGKGTRSKMAAAITEILFHQPNAEKLPPREQLDMFDNRFSRCSRTLHFTACLILGDSEKAERAVRNCWFRASRKLPIFESEGPFRSWIIRLLISEALSILRQSHTEARPKIQ